MSQFHHNCLQEDESAVVEELDKLLMSDLDPVISDLPTVPTDKVETIEDQLPEVPASVSQIICRNICKHNNLPFLQEPKSKNRTPVAVADSF